jgi:hypothetical protein
MELQYCSRRETKVTKRKIVTMRVLRPFLLREGDFLKVNFIFNDGKAK